MQERNYLFCDELKKLSVDALYSGSIEALEILRYNVNCLVQTESPIALSLFNKRIRETLGMKKISQNAFSILEKIIKEFDFVIEYNEFDPIIWSEIGPHKMKFFRKNSERTLYQIEKSELLILIEELDDGKKDKNTLYHDVLRFLGYEVLTQKAADYLDYVLAR